MEKLPNILAELNPPPGDQPYGKIFIFSNGGVEGWINAVALAEDGHCLAGAVVKHEDEIKDSLAMRHMTYLRHFPGGYELVFTVAEDPQVLEAYAKNRDLGDVYRMANAIELED